MTPSGYTEDALVEQPAIALLGQLGWEVCHAYTEFDRGASPLGRETRAEVVLTARLRPALRRLNPDATEAALEIAIEELTRDLLLPWLISGEVDVSELDIAVPEEAG